MMINWLKAALFVGVLVHAGYARTSRPVEPATTQPAVDTAPRGVLAGPTVSDDGLEAEVPFGGRRRDQRSVSARQWFRVLDRLDLDPGQRARINRIRSEFRRAARRDRETRREQRNETSARTPQAPGAATVAPQVEAFQQRIWMLLDETQQDRMRADLAAVRSRIARDRAGGKAPPASGAVELDEAGRRRLAFLRAHQVRRRRAPRSKGGDGRVVRSRNPQGGLN